MDLIHTHWTLTLQQWTCPYPSKGGPVLNVFLCYNRKTRTFSFGTETFVQRDFAGTSSVSGILSTLWWEKLASRREAHQVTQLYKITNNDIDVDATHYLQPKTQRSRRENNKQFVIPQASSTPFQNSFFPRTNKLWNNLPQSIIDCVESKTFRENYLDHLQTRNDPLFGRGSLRPPSKDPKRMIQEETSQVPSSKVCRRFPVHLHTHILVCRYPQTIQERRNSKWAGCL